MQTAKTKLDKAINGTIISASVVIVVTGLLHGWNAIADSGYNPFGKGGEADYKTDSTVHRQVVLAASMPAVDAAPYIVGSVQAAEPEMLTVAANNQASKQVIAEPAQRKPAVKKQPESKPVQSTANKRDLERLSANKHIRTASKAAKPTRSNKAKQSTAPVNQQVTAPKQTMQQMLAGMTTAKPRVNSMDAISSLTAANRSIAHGKGTPRTDSKQGAIPATNQQIARDVKSKVEPATKPSNQTKLTIAGVLETDKPAITRQEATNTKQPEYSDNLMTNGGAQERVEAAKRLAVLKIKAAKQAKALRALRAKREADKQAKADKQWSEYLAAKRAKRAAIAAKKERAEQAWIAHVEAKRAARAEARKKANARQEASKQVTRKAVKHSKQQAVAMPKRKQKAVIHSEGVKKRDAVTVCIISPVTNQEKCI